MFCFIHYFSGTGDWNTHPCISPTALNFYLDRASMAHADTSLTIPPVTLRRRRERIPRILDQPPHLLLSFDVLGIGTPGILNSAWFHQIPESIFFIMIEVIAIYALQTIRFV